MKERESKTLELCGVGLQVVARLPWLGTPKFQAISPTSREPGVLV